MPFQPAFSAALCCALWGSARAQLLITEYVEGSSFNKAIEITNTNVVPGIVNLATFELAFYFAPQVSPNTVVPLYGGLASGDTYVVCKSTADPTLLALCDQTSASSWFNGDDTIVLRSTGGGAVVDSIGQIGVDPGDGFGTPPRTTFDTTLCRSTTVADTDPADAYDVSGWHAHPKDYFSGLGNPSCEPATAPPTPAPATSSPPTPSPATQAPATTAPATSAPPTSAPATAAPATLAPATPAPATSAPATSAPPTSAPATAAPATLAPATPAPATTAPATSAPPTSAPATQPTAAPATPAPLVPGTTGSPTFATTPAPATSTPATSAPVTSTPATSAPATATPATVSPTQAQSPTAVPPAATSFPAPQQPPTLVPATTTPPAATLMPPATSTPATTVHPPITTPPSTPVPPTQAPPISTPLPSTTSLPPVAHPSPPPPATEAPAHRPTDEPPATMRARQTFNHEVEQARRAANAASGAAVAASLGAGAGPAMRLAAVALTCDPHNYDPELRYGTGMAPLQLRVAGSEAFGTLIGNMFLAVGIGLLGFCTFAAAEVVGKKVAPEFFAELDAQGLTRFPSLPLAAFQLLYQGTALGSMDLVLNGPSAGLVAAGWAGVLLCVAVPVCVLWAMARAHGKARVVKDPVHVHCIDRALIGDSEWVSCDPHPHWVARWASVVLPYREAMLWYIFVEYAASFVIAGVSSITPVTYTGCGHVKLACGIVFAGLLALEGALRPHLLVRNTWLDLLLLALQAAGMGAHAVMYYSWDPALPGGPLHDVGNALLLAALVVVLVRAALDLVQLARVVCTGRRERLQAEEWLSKGWLSGAPSDRKSMRGLKSYEIHDVSAVSLSAITPQPGRPPSPHLASTASLHMGMSVMLAQSSASSFRLSDQGVERRPRGATISHAPPAGRCRSRARLLAESSSAGNGRADTSLGAGMFTRSNTELLPVMHPLTRSPSYTPIQPNSSPGTLGDLHAMRKPRVHLLTSLASVHEKPQPPNPPTARIYSTEQRDTPNASMASVHERP